MDAVSTDWYLKLAVVIVLKKNPQIKYTGFKEK
jgi:hypothetical protein